MKVLLHVNYYEGPGEKLERLFRLAADNGCDGVELRWRYRFDDRTQAEYQQTVAKLKHRYPDFEIVFGGNLDFCRGEAAAVAREEAEFGEFLRWAKENCGTRIINFFTGAMVAPGRDFCEFEYNGSGMADAGDYQRAADGLRRVGDLAAAQGIRLALETHNGYLHDLAPACRKLMQATAHPAVGLNYDQGNIQLNVNGSSVDDFFAEAGDWVYYAHLKNVQVVRGQNGGGFFITRLEEGCINQFRVMELLKTHLQGDCIAIEYPCTGDSFTAARRDMAYIRELKTALELH